MSEDPPTDPSANPPRETLVRIDSKPSRLQRWVSLALAGVAIAVAVRLLQDQSAAAAPVPLPGASGGSIPAIGASAPDFTLQALDGRSVRLEDYRGQVVLLNFWATWCPPCRTEMPEFEQIYAERKDRDFVVLAVNIQEAPEQVTKFVHQFSLTFPILLDTSGAVSQLYGIQGLPTTYFIGKDGRIGAFNVGPLNKAGVYKKLEQVQVLNNTP